MHIRVLKRNGTYEDVSFDKVLVRIKLLCTGLPHVDAVLLSQKIIRYIANGISTVELDRLGAETAAFMSTVHPQYGTLAARLFVSNLHKCTSDRWLDVLSRMHGHGLLDERMLRFVEANEAVLQDALDYGRDYLFDYFGLRTLERSYLMSIDGVTVERPQHMHMRIALGISLQDNFAAIDLSHVLQTYTLLSQLMYTHATPTMYNAGTVHNQLASCFLLPLKDDSIEGIFDTVKQCAIISKNAGGIGLSVHGLRAAGSRIRGTNGTSNGLAPVLRVFEETALYVDQGGGKRKGSVAIYLEPWHADIRTFLMMKRARGDMKLRARDLFYALWIPDLFMERVAADGPWSLFCPNKILPVKLQELHSDAFRTAYTHLEASGKANAVIPARELWALILESQIETGMPYMLYKDACNAKSNQQHLGTIQSSNLCTEIIQYSSPDEIAVCNLASVSLPKFVWDGAFHFPEFMDVVRTMTRNLNSVIDVTFYPLPEMRVSNLRHRPIGLGVQGLADVFFALDLSWDSQGARDLNRRIFKCLYYAAVQQSIDMAVQQGPYDSFPGSPASRGLLQPDLWGVNPDAQDGDLQLDWAALRERTKAHGMRNSLLVAPMPTASTAQILGNVECFEPQPSNIYSRRVLSGDFVIVNKHLVNDLMGLKLWNDAMCAAIIERNGSVDFDAIPPELRNKYRTAWELPQRIIVDMAIDRAPYIDQSQSMNVYFAHVDANKLLSLHLYGWRAGLKTGIYYLRTRPAADPIKVPTAAPTVVCTEEVCTSCSA